MRSVLSAAVDGAERGIDIGNGLEARAADVGQAKTRGVESDAVDDEARSAGLVEHDLERIAIQQIDAVIRGIFRQRIDLCEDIVEVSLQAGTGRVRRGRVAGALAWCRGCRRAPSAVVSAAFEEVSAIEFWFVDVATSRVNAALLAVPVTPVRVAILALRSARVETSPTPVPKVMT